MAGYVRTTCSLCCTCCDWRCVTMKYTTLCRSKRFLPSRFTLLRDSPVTNFWYVMEQRDSESICLSYCSPAQRHILNVFFFVEFSRSFLQSRTGATQTKKLFSMTYEKFQKYLSDFCTSKQDKYKSWLYVCYPTGAWIVKEINK